MITFYSDKNTKYIVTTKCSGKANGTLCIKLFGETGASIEIYVLKHGLEKFGKEEILVPDLGKLTSVKLQWRNNTGMCVISIGVSSLKCLLKLECFHSSD